MVITSKEVNCLIYRYLMEAGFLHSSFAFGHESLLLEDPLFIQEGQAVAAGSLVNLVQKGLKFIELEAHLNEDGSVRVCEAPFNILRPHVCDAKTKADKGQASQGGMLSRTSNYMTGAASKPPSSAAISDRKRDRDSQTATSQKDDPGQRKEKARRASMPPSDDDMELGQLGRESKPQQPRDMGRRSSISKDMFQPVAKKNDSEEPYVSSQPQDEKIDLLDAEMKDDSAREDEEEVEVKREGAAADGLQPSPLALYLEDIPFEQIAEANVVPLSRHTKQVFACQWNPAGTGSIATVGADGLGVLWMPDADDKEGKTFRTKVLDHRSQAEDLDVNTLEWNRVGMLLATGDYNGNAYIWNEQGRKVHNLRKHSEAIFTLKWNKKGNYLLTGSGDQTVILWDASAGEAKQVFDCHKGPVLDVDWKTNTVFASCSSDQTIYLCKLHEKQPVRVFEGHGADVNAIRWDPSCLWLASCSDDHSLRIWDPEKQEAGGLRHLLTGHRKQVYCLDWSPTGPRSENPGLDVRLASGSHDAEGQVWCLETGQSLFSLLGHSNYIYNITYSPDAQFIATGSVDKTVKIWSAKDGRLVRNYTAKSGVYDLAWSVDSDRLAVCDRSHDLKILDLKY